MIKFALKVIAIGFIGNAILILTTVTWASFVFTALGTAFAGKDAVGWFSPKGIGAALIGLIVLFIASFFYLKISIKYLNNYFLNTFKRTKYIWLFTVLTLLLSNLVVTQFLNSKMLRSVVFLTESKLNNQSISQIKEKYNVLENTSEDNKLFEKIKIAASNNDSMALFLLSEIYKNGAFEENINLSKSEQYLLKAIELNSFHAKLTHLMHSFALERNYYLNNRQPLSQGQHENNVYERFPSYIKLLELERLEEDPVNKTLAALAIANVTIYNIALENRALVQEEQKQERITFQSFNRAAKYGSESIAASVAVSRYLPNPTLTDVQLLDIYSMFNFANDMYNAATVIEDLDEKYKGEVAINLESFKGVFPKKITLDSKVASDLFIITAIKGLNDRKNKKIVSDDTRLALNYLQLAFELSGYDEKYAKDFINKYKSISIESYPSTGNELIFQENNYFYLQKQISANNCTAHDKFIASIQKYNHHKYANKKTRAIWLNFLTLIKNEKCSNPTMETQVK